MTIGRRDSRDGSSPLNRDPDSHAGDWYWINVGGSGQVGKENLLDSVLRIDVNSREQKKTVFNTGRKPGPKYRRLRRTLRLGI